MKRIFFLDDDIDDRDLFKAALNLLDTETDYVEAKDGHEGLDMIADPAFVKPDMIFVDLNMPRVNGYEFVMRIKKMKDYADIPTYIYTTSASARERINCIAAGASGYIIKHMRAEDLAKELKSLIQKVSTPPDLTLF